MAKIKHNDSFDTYASIINDAKKRGLIQLNDENVEFNGQYYLINNQQLVNFGYCGYLGLEMHSALKLGSLAAIGKYGMQFGVSRAYITSKPENELLGLLSEMYDGQKVIVQSSTSSSHIANIPNIIESSDAIILDQQVHFSVQTGAQLCRQKGVPIEMIRHNNLEMLKRKYNELKPKHRRVWYLVDGVYSMFGDTTPIDELKVLLKELTGLYLYVDDAHGMSWKGATGGGYFYNKMGKHNKVVLNTTMGKGFGVTGGITVYPNEEFYERVKVFGGPLTYSHPLSPAITGAAIASAKIHLGKEIGKLQNELSDRIQECNELMSRSNLPIMSDSETPIFFVGLGQPKSTYNMVRRLMNDGFYVNSALFPAVPIKCSGIRFSISNHNGIADIQRLVKSLKHHYPQVLEEDAVTDQKVRRAFKLPDTEKTELSAPIEVKASIFEKQLALNYHTTIDEINEDIWNSCFENKGSFDYDGMKFLEKVFKDNDNARDNWKFHYVIIERNQKVVAATFITESLVKDDIFSKESISIQLEERRHSDPSLFVSNTLIMGSLLTEGSHLFLDQTSEFKDSAMEMLMTKIDELHDSTETDNVILRDFDIDDNLDGFFLENGFVRMDMPNTNVIEFETFSNPEDFATKLNSRHRRHFRNDVLPYTNDYYVSVDENLEMDMIEHCYQLFLNVKNRNLAVNEFAYPIKMLHEMIKNPKWEVANVYLRGIEKPVSTIWSFKAKNNFCPMFIGLDYQYLESHKVYKQSLFRTIERANILGYSKVLIGYSADIEKRKLGAKQIPKVAYTRFNDNYSLDVMESMAILQTAK